MTAAPTTAPPLPAAPAPRHADPTATPAGDPTADEIVAIFQAHQLRPVRNAYFDCSAADGTLGACAIGAILLDRLGYNAARTAVHSFLAYDSVARAGSISVHFRTGLMTGFDGRRIEWAFQSDHPDTQRGHRVGAEVWRRLTSGIEQAQEAPL